MSCSEKRPCLVEILFYEATGMPPDGDKCCKKCPMRKEVEPGEVHTSRVSEPDDPPGDQSG